MGKGQSSTPNELKFIYEMLAEGYSDTDILAKYEDLEKHGKLGSLPSRQDVRFIRQKRKEYEAAEKVLQGKLKLYTDPSIAQARDEHNTEIRALIEQWKLEMKTPRIDEMFLNIEGEVQLNYSTHDYQFNPLFECIKEHLPVDELWRNYAQWKDKFMKYFQTCTKLIKIIEHRLFG